MTCNPGCLFGFYHGGPCVTPTKDDLDLAEALHINYCADLVDDGTPWEVAAEPEPSYFETLKEAIVFLVELGEPGEAVETGAGGMTIAEFDVITWYYTRYPRARQFEPSQTDMEEFAEAFATHKLSESTREIQQLRERVQRADKEFSILLTRAESAERTVAELRAELATLLQIMRKGAEVMADTHTFHEDRYVESCARCQWMSQVKSLQPFQTPPAEKRDALMLEVEKFMDYVYLVEIFGQTFDRKQVALIAANFILRTPGSEPEKGTS